MGPKKPALRAVRVQFVVRVMVMPAMDGNPIGRSILAAATSQNRDDAFDPNRTAETAVRKEAVVADDDAHHSDRVVADYPEQHAGPAEEPRKKRKYFERMDGEKKTGRAPIDCPRLAP